MSIKRTEKRSDPPVRGTTTVTSSVIEKSQAILLQWGKLHYRNFPWRENSELWKALVTEVLLQRTKAGSVEKIYDQFFTQFDTPQQLASASVDDIEKAIYTLGLRWRAPLLKALGQELENLDLKTVRDRDELLQLPGVGSYVASAWLGFNGGVRSVIIDANVVRWLCRMVGQPMNGETRRKRWLIELADAFTPHTNFKEYNYAILDFTMEICARQPLCATCPLGPDLCVYGRKQLKKSKL